MRQFVFVLSAVFLLGISTSAQEASQNVPSSNFSFAEAAAPASTNISLGTNPFSASPAPSSSSSSFELSPAENAEGTASAAADPPPQGVYGVRPTFNFEGYVGYTWFRFYEVPGTEVNMNGLNFSIQYYPRSWIGADGEFVLTLGNQYPYQARFLLGMGGARVRMAPLRRNVFIWAHALAGATHFTPQTAYGSQGAFAYELGVGADINLSHARYAIRAGADMIGTTYFGTYQLSPKISAGMVYRF
ncbi:MAG TPA: hypothetical protein VMF66_10140 [Candidatus Acidoferrum sp.]|nr:hypothetical protein [Candidatus Acidoferrum sp.]